MRNLVLQIIAIILLLLLFVWAIYPPAETIRLGKDLRGGVSLIYAVDVGDEADAQAVLDQTIQVLQDRVNPQGVLDISMEPLGNDRIEIIMPLPSPEVQALREAYMTSLDRLLREAQIPPGQLMAALRENRAPQTFGDDATTERGRLMQQLQSAYNGYQDALQSLQQARQNGVEEDEIIRLEQRVADEQIVFEDLRDRVLDLSLDRARIVRILSLSTLGEQVRDDDGRVVRDPETRQPRTRPSPREIELRTLRNEFSHLADRLDEVVAAFDAYQAQRTGLDDPEDLKRLLRGAGVLEFRIAVRPGADDVNIDDLRTQLQDRGPDNVDSLVARWFEINDLQQWYETPEQLDRLQAMPREYFEGRGLVAAERDGRYYLLLYTTPGKSMTHEADRGWSIQSASRGIDPQGRPAVDFRLNQTGGMLMSRLTGPNIGEPMAIVLDGQVYSAPRLQGQIATRGQITGNFSGAELSYLIRVLAAGALEARLSENPIAENVLGPSIGEDNLRRGLQAFVIATIAVAVFMTAYYFFAGMVAVFALLANGLIIFGMMSLMQGTFTLPGLAGIVLTIGMAVDANVLIYERIREEMFAGELDLRGCIRQGYNKALSTIIDANITNLIVCLVLFQTATTEVKGFALTLTIGICATLFTSLFVTRVIYRIYTDVVHARNLPMLPTVVPAIHHLLEPNINWIGLRKIFWGISAIGVVASVILVGTRGVDLFDTELRGGVAVTMRTAIADENSAERIWLRHIGDGSVEHRIRQIAEKADPDAAATEQQRVEQLVLQEFARASVLTVGRTRVGEGGSVEAQSFQIKVPNPRGLDDDLVITNVIVDAVVEEFEGLLDATPPLHFAGEDDTNHAPYTFPIEHDELGVNIGEFRLTERVTDYLGGVAVVIRDFEPPVQLDEIRTRIDRMRAQPDFGDARARSVEVIGMDLADPDEPARGYRAVVVVSADPSISFLRSGFDVWDQQLALSEWTLIREALTRRTSLEQVTSFSAAVARSLAAAANVAIALSLFGILLYIWIRFGSLRYSMAAIVALVHDVTIALGVLALTAYLSRIPIVHDLLLIDEFRIDLGVVAALLTIIGYSLNDTIVILDRIRENRGKHALASASTVNRSINQTISRTVLTSTTTLMAILVMYVAGGGGIRAFAFTLLIGLLVGTYSSVAIASPLVFSADVKKRPERAEPEEEKPFWSPEESQPGPA